MQNRRISDQILDATFGAGMLRSSSQEVYFDKDRVDVLVLTYGYLSSVLGDQSFENRRLAKRIEGGDYTDDITESRYELVPRLMLTDFIEEYKVHANAEPFSTYLTVFLDYWQKRMSDMVEDEVSLDELCFTKNTQNHFFEKFQELNEESYIERRLTFDKIYLSTARGLAQNWIESLCNQVLE